MGITISNTSIDKCGGGISAPESVDLKIDNVQITRVSGDAIAITPSGGASVKLTLAALGSIHVDWKRAKSEQEKQNILTKSGLWDRIKTVASMAQAVTAIDELIKRHFS